MINAKRNLRPCLKQIMIPLIDADCLLHEIGYCGEYKDEEGVEQVREFDFVRELLDMRISEICEAVFNSAPPILFLTSSEKLVKQWNRRNPDYKLEHKPNFRLAVAKKKGYKEQRKKGKPFHYYNLSAHMIDKYDVRIVPGIEADDAMSVYQMKSDNTIICSRDKDLKQVPGWHYSWPCGKQKAFGPIEIDELGFLEYDASKRKLTGGGLMFFYAQLLMGDPVDNIPGLPLIGPHKTYQLLKDCTDVDMLQLTALDEYQRVYPNTFIEELEEQAQLVWMVRKLDEYGNPVMWGLSEEGDG